MTPFVSIIIPTHNRSKTLKKTIKSFLRINYPKKKYEIIIADNNSTDGTKYLINTFKKNNKKIKYIFVKNQGATFARNEAAKIARGSIFYFTDDDMIATKKLIKEIVKVFQLDNMIGTVTGLILPKFPKNTPAWVKKYLINSWLSLTDKSISKQNLIISKKDFGVFSCHQAIKKNIFFECGGFNPDYTFGTVIGDGETGLNIKLQKKGYKFGYTNTSKIFHILPLSRLNFRYLIKRAKDVAYSDSFSYCKKKNHQSLIVLNLVNRNLFYAPLYLLYIIIKSIFLKTTFRFLPAFLVYFYFRNFFDIKLLQYKFFQDTVAIEDWISPRKLDIKNLKKIANLLNVRIN